MIFKQTLLWLLVATGVTPTTATGPTVVHTFSTPGTQVITLTTCNSAGCSSKTKTLTVLNPAPQIQSVSVPAAIGSAEPLAAFSAVATGKPTLAYHWTLMAPDRTSSLSGQTVAWTPDALGAHQLTLNVTNDSGVTSATRLFNVVASSFADVPAASPTYADPVENLVANGITAGCGDAPPTFCPGAVLSRAEAAIFLSLTKALGTGSPVPPPPTGSVFADVSRTYWAAPWIEDLARRGIVFGCSTNPALFCPAAPLLRGDTAVWIIRARHGSAYVPPPPRGRFLDVPISSPLAPYVEELAAEGITSGCSPTLYCPNDSLTRWQIAVFLTTAFGLTQHPQPVRFVAGLCPTLCSYPAGATLPFELAVQGGIPTSYEYDWQGDGVFEETSAVPVALHTYSTPGIYRPAVRLRRGGSLLALTHSPITISPVVFSPPPPATTNFQAVFIDHLQPTRAEGPGALQRTAFAVQATSASQTGYFVYLAIGTGVFRPIAVLPAALSGVTLVAPPLPPGTRASIYLRAFTPKGLGSASNTVSLTLP